MTRLTLSTAIAAILMVACAPAAEDTVENTVDQATETVEAVVETVMPATAVMPEAPRDPGATADILNRNGESTGSALLYQGTDGVLIRIAVSGLEPGVHGMHFHAAGTCADPEEGFMATGGHVMPLGKPHGYMHPEGPHAGNLPNLIVHADGTAVVELHTHLVSLSGDVAPLLDEDGSTLIIHENEDDHFTQPIGGAGGRVACGVIEAAP
ncbi:MAG: superoxide dismutase family protein [Pseudomonadota bacterium]